MKNKLTPQQIADEMVISVTEAVSIMQKEIKDKVLDQQALVGMSMSFLMGILASKLGVQKELERSLDILDKLRKEQEKKQ